MNMECSRVSPFRVGCLAVAVTICIESYSGRPRAINRGLVPRRYKVSAHGEVHFPVAVPLPSFCCSWTRRPRFPNRFFAAVPVVAWILRCFLALSILRLTKGA